VVLRAANYGTEPFSGPVLAKYVHIWFLLYDIVGQVLCDKAIESRPLHKLFQPTLPIS
jgi:hypothetical protein